MYSLCTVYGFGVEPICGVVSRMKTVLANCSRVSCVMASFRRRPIEECYRAAIDVDLLFEPALGEGLWQKTTKVIHRYTSYTAWVSLLTGCMSIQLCVEAVETPTKCLQKAPILNSELVWLCQASYISKFH